MANFNSSNQSSASFHASAIESMKASFKAFYVNQPHHALPKEDKNSDYWAEMWYQFCEVYSTSTFLPYLFSVGCLDLTLWEVFQKEGDIPFHKAIELSGDRMDLSETNIGQPHWLHYPHLEKDGANLEEFLETVKAEGDYSKEQTMGYLQDNCLYPEEEAQAVFQYLGITPVQVAQPEPEVKPISEVKPTMSNSTTLSAFDTIMEAFKAYYQCQPNYLPKNEKDGDYWSNTWSRFLEVKGFETFLPYLFQSGMLYEQMWKVFQANPHKTFSEIDEMAGEQMDWLDDLLYGPQWRGTKYEYLEKTGASLSEVIESLQCFRDYQPKEVSSFTKEYWLQYPCFDEEEVDKLFQYLGITPEEPAEEVKPEPVTPITPEVKPTMSNSKSASAVATPMLPLIDRLNDDDRFTQWIKAIQEVMDPICWEALQWLRDSRELGEFYEVDKCPFQKSLAYYAMIPLWPQWFSKAIEKGNVFAYEQSEDNHQFGFSEALNIPTITAESLDLEADELDPGLKGKYLLVKPPFKGDQHKKTIAALIEGGMKLVSLADLHATSIADADITAQDVIRFLLCFGAKRDTKTGEYLLSPCRYVQLKVKWLPEEGVWAYREDDGRVLKTRLFYGVNGLAPKSTHAVFLMALAYICEGKTFQVVKGRRAFLANLFQDEVTVGWSHPILDEFIPRKLGTLQVGVNHATWLLDVAKDSDFMSVLEAYNDKGYSSFVHKGGKYAVIEAECTGFSVLPKNIDDLVQQYADDEEGLRAAVLAAKETLSPEDMETFIGWLADKLPKYTGRALWLVPSAAMIPAEGEKPLEYEDVADFINSF